MSTKTITEYSPEALKNISTYLEFSQFEQEPVLKEMTFSNYSEIGYALSAIFSAIETIGLYGDKADLATCGGLATIGKKLVPDVELEFLDKLLIEKEVENIALKIKDL
ncbi:hypothetical protein [Flavobacterium lacustre]|uniref:hypothetical protein n=1 Tax=Flavobacterium lacustre TaxID=3016339 RepID=UPI0022B68AE1|nr:hypothetical protein [Flavobacterium lacustre]